MASTFPAAIANEPPPLDASSEDEDSEEFRSHCLKLDVPSGEPTPVSTPFKRPSNKSPNKVNNIQPESRVDDVITVSNEDNQDGPEEFFDVNETFQSTAPAPTKEINEIKVNGIGGDSIHIDEEARVEIHEPISNDQISEGDKLTGTEESNRVQTELQETDLAEATDYCDSIAELTINGPVESVLESTPLDLNTGSPIDENSAPSENDEYASNTNVSKEDESESPLQFEDSDSSSDSNIRKNSPLPVAVPEEPATCVENDDDYYEFQTSEVQSSSNETENTAQIEASTNPAANETCPAVDSFEDDDDDFGAFQSIPHAPVQPPPLQENALVDDGDDDDDFGDFAHNPVQAPSTVPAIQKIAQTSQEEVEDFADFQDCSFQSCDVPGAAKTSSTTSDIALIRSRIDTIIKSLFVIETTPPEAEVTTKPVSIDSDISLSNDSTWAKVQDFEGSHGLMFKWLSSLTEKRLLKSLNINTSNIMYHEKWGTIEVPKFAASLVQSQSPLQPQSCNKFESQTKSEENPAIVNNNTIISDDHDKPPSISAEAQEILRQLPDLSYMRANTLVFPQTSPSGL